MSRLSKLSICLLFLLPTVNLWSQNMDLLHMSFVADRPNKSLMPAMSNMFGGAIRLSYTPTRYAQAGFEYALVFSNYSSVAENQTFQFDNLPPTDLRVTYESSATRHMFGSRIMNPSSPNFVKPFFTPQIGLMSMHSSIYIPDPDDDDNCAPLQNDIVHRFTGGVYGFETGLEISLNPKSHRNKKDYYGDGAFLLFSVGMVRGMHRFEYINVDHMKKPDDLHNHGNLEGRDLNARFINLQTQQVHEHRIAEVYRSPLQYVYLNIGLSLRVGGPRNNKNVW
jgi:hypothetical protein